MQASVRRAGARTREVLAGVRRRLRDRWDEWGRAIAARWAVATARPEAGMATAEYAIATLAAVAFAGLLLVIMRSDEVRGMLLGIIREALSR
ncbi:hypothetical protein C8046_08620 [Serinibacter arcticus]|uniref:DUF4244 domain-containing protein n=1 Tax=Serinibacter arcticus TaxID=1655435 RepID=A0A2U1ZZQ0_9MICO|nr:DUF4244 domain-containing protein [Serinibacter arcticus]PWD52458.1 hypothetical protein C8046_08620 [Serinibacter arcticus]